jgi:hypothetical protein
VLLLQGTDHCSRTFLFFVFFLFWMCVSVVPLGYCVVAEAEYNWYLLNNNIYFLLKKATRARNKDEDMMKATF